MKHLPAVALLCGLLILSAWLVAKITRHETELAVRNAVESVRNLLQITPEVKTSSEVWPQQSQGGLQLATVTNEFPVEYTFEHSYLGSTKRLKLRGLFKVKAGFDLQDRFSITVTENGRKVIADFPAPQVLSVEMEKYEVLDDENGWWNYLTQENQQETVAAMQAEARRAAESGTILPDAEKSLRTQFQALGQSRGMEWQVNFRPARWPKKDAPAKSLPLLLP
ncbi:MAG: DUF4230 domain-containing protein [Chthoniobacteraceae bacterium]